MTSWFKKVLRTHISNTEDDSQAKVQVNQKQKQRRIVVSFDKHIQLHDNSSSSQLSNSKSKSHKRKKSAKQSFMSHTVEPQEDEQYQNSQFFYADEIQINCKHKDKGKKQKKKMGLMTDLSSLNSDEASDHSSQSQQSYYNLGKSQKGSTECLQASDMYNIMKMTHHIPQLRGQYLTLRHLNRILSNVEIHYDELISYVLNKSSESVSSITKFSEYKRKNNTFNTHIMKKFSNQTTENVKDKETEKKIQNFYYNTYSNGFVYQYYPVRALIWKLLSGYLPHQKQKWIWKMEVSLLKYRQLVKQFIVETVLKNNKSINGFVHKNTAAQQTKIRQKSSTIASLVSTNQRQINVSLNERQGHHSNRKNSVSQIHHKVKDHPLNLKQNSKWKNYFQDYQLWNMIERDTIRTRQANSFFHQNHLFSLVNNNEEFFDDKLQENIVDVELQNNQKIRYDLNELHLSKDKKKKKTNYTDALTRIIFIYLKTNPQVKYYQGINEIVAIIYYSLTNKNGEYFRRVSESDTYQIFTLLMGKLMISPLPNPQNKKMPVFDHFSSGDKYFQLLTRMIKKYDFRLFEHLNENNCFQYLKAMVIRWFMTIFLTQFSLDESLILWDGIMVLIGNFSKRDQVNQKSNKQANSINQIKLTQFLLYMALTVIHLNRNQIVEGKAQDILLIFQKIKQKPEQILQKSMTLFKSYPKLLE